MPLYSHSRLSSFEKCPLQYRFRYIDRIKRDVQGIEAFMGNRVHAVLERLYNELAEGRCPTLDDLLLRFRADWDAGFSERIRIVKKEFTADHYRGVGERCIANYYRSHHPFDGEVTLGLEQRVQIALDPAEQYRIQGYIDRLTRIGPGIYAIHDYKTSSRLPSDVDLRRDRQLTFYQMGVSRLYPDAREIRLIWHYLAFDQDLVSSRTEADIDGHRQRTIRLIDTIEAAREHPPKESPLCRWCDYRDICPTQQPHAASTIEAARPAAPPGVVPEAGVRRTGEAAGNKGERQRPERTSPGVMQQLNLFS